MKGKFLKKVAKNPKLIILTEIKRSQGLSVSELCDRIGLSYMGVKQHCIALEKEGYLDTWRRPKGMGRPEKAYRLTDTAQEFFPSEFSNFTTSILDSLQEVYGPNAPEKILFNIYQHEGTKLSAAVNGTSLEEKARALAALRDDRGYMSEYYFDRESGKHQIVEFNSPILACAERFPILRELERTMFERVLGATVQRREERISGLFKCVFELS
ncbi:MAG: winged helix-turn-helix transcriptional regulator [Candidatus Methylacidiphilales bacterium]|nr:winged helix-turn-helix transcriptional regulator [Candidatus Methylacidiphilales bacterium]